MKILHLSSERSWRGGEQQIAYLVKASILHGLEITVACKKGSAFETWCKSENINHLSLSFSNELDFTTALKLKKYCNINHVDFIHAHSSHSHAMAIWSSILGCKSEIIVSRRVDFPIKNNFLSRFKFNHKSVKKYICVSNAIEKILRNDLKQPNKCVTVHSGIDLNRFANSKRNYILHDLFDLPHETTIIGNISAIADHKDYFTFVDTAKLISGNRADVIFAIIGDGPLLNEIKDYIEEHGLTKKVLLTGFRKDIPNLIQDLDIFLMTSKTEGLGTTVLDAIANYIPVVATNAGGIPEMIKHNQTGMLYNIGDTQNLAKGVQELLDHPKKRRSLTENAMELLNKNFLKEKTASKTFKVYQELLDLR